MPHQCRRRLRPDRRRGETIAAINVASATAATTARDPHTPRPPRVILRTLLCHHPRPRRPLQPASPRRNHPPNHQTTSQPSLRPLTSDLPLLTSDLRPSCLPSNTPNGTV